MSGKAQRFKKTTMAFRWDGTFDGQVRLAEWLRGWTKHEPATVGENVEIDGQTLEPGDYVICNMVQYPHVIGREAFERTYQVDGEQATAAEPADGRWRKRPVVIEAHRWYRNGDHPADHVGDLEYLEAGELVVIGPAERRERDWEGAVVRRFRLPGSCGTPCPECAVDLHDHGWIDTLEGGHRVCPGDWIITGIAGERYPCKDRIFRATYEPAGEPIMASLDGLQVTEAVKTFFGQIEQSPAYDGSMESGRQIDDWMVKAGYRGCIVWDQQGRCCYGELPLYPGDRLIHRGHGSCVTIARPVSQVPNPQCVTQECQDHGETGLDIGCAVQAMRHGHRVQRRGWNGKGMFVFLRPGQPLAPDQATREPTWPEEACMVLATAHRTLQPGWNASTPDLLALDWQIVK